MAKLAPPFLRPCPLPQAPRLQVGDYIAATPVSFIADPRERVLARIDRVTEDGTALYRHGGSWLEVRAGDSKVLPPPRPYRLRCLAAAAGGFLAGALTLAAGLAWFLFSDPRLPWLAWFLF